VIQPDHTENQIAQIKQNLFEMMDAPHQDTTQIQRAFKAIVEDHQTFIREQMLQEISQNAMDQDSKDAMEELLSKKTRIENQKKNLQKEFMNEVQTTLKNAYIMPAQLRDLAEEFLESQDKNFKVGLFQSKKKTNEAKEIRLQTFLHALIESMETTIQWKLREKTIELLQKYKLTSESLLQQVQQLTISFQKDDLF